MGVVGNNTPPTLPFYYGEEKKLTKSNAVARILGHLTSTSPPSVKKIPPHCGILSIRNTQKISLF